MKRAMATAAGVIVFAAFAVIATHKRANPIRPIWGECWSGPIWAEQDARERIKILESRPVPLTPPGARLMLIDQD